MNTAVFLEQRMFDEDYPVSKRRLEEMLEAYFKSCAARLIPPQSQIFMMHELPMDTIPLKGKTFDMEYDSTSPPASWTTTYRIEEVHDGFVVVVVVDVPHFYEYTGEDMR